MIRLIVILNILFINSLIFCVPKLDISQFGASAKSISIGRIEGFTNKSFNVFENAASLANLTQTNVSEFFSSSMDNEVKFSSFALAIPLQEGTISIGHMSAQVKDLIHTKVDSFSNIIVPESLFDYYDSISKLAYGLPLNSNLNIGSAINYYRFKMGSYVTGTGYNLDLSFLYTPNNFYSMSLIFNNIISNLDINYDNNKSLDLPFRIHAAHQFSIKNLNLYFKTQYRDTVGKIETGLGLDFEMPYFNFLIFNFGICQTYPLSSYITHINAGFDLNFSNINISLCYEKNNYFYSPNQYYLSLDFNF